LFSWELKKVSVIGSIGLDGHSIVTVSAMVDRGVSPLHNKPRQPSISKDAVTASRPDGLGRRLLQSVQVCLSSCVRASDMCSLLNIFFLSNQLRFHRHRHHRYTQ